MIENELTVKKRNDFVDIMRGIAMMLVVLQHTMTGCTVNSEKSLLFNIAWTLQMPLFILISGYVTRYSRKISDWYSLWRYIKRRTIAYILPWGVWSFIVRGIIFGQYDLLSIKWLLWHMDSGYWFLFTIWTISMIFGFSQFAAKKIKRGPEQLWTLVFYISGMGVLAGVGLVAGLSFLSIKLTLYYMPYFFVGYLYGEFRDKVLEQKWGKRVKDVAVVLSTAVWLFILTRCHIYALPDSGVALLLRVASSITGCISVCGLCQGVFGLDSNILWGGALRQAGKHSLEIYLIHYLLLNLLQMTITPIMETLQGIGMIALNFFITVGLTTIVIILLNSNKLCRLILFGKGG